MKKINQIAYKPNDLVLVRTDFNVPLDEKGRIAESMRIDSSIETLRYLQDKNVRTVILCHLGDDGTKSLLPVYEYLKEHHFKNILFFKEQLLDQNFDEQLRLMNEGDIMLCENIRKNPEEKENDREFCGIMAKKFDVYVNECFSVSHRKHASTYGIPLLMEKKCAGFQTIIEVETLSKTLNPEHPFVLIQGGVKIETKLPILEMLIPKVDHILLAGALLNTLLHAQGKEIGVSIYEDIVMPDIITQSIVEGKMLIPKEVLVKNSEGNIVSRSIDNIEKTDYIGDMTHEYIDTLVSYLKKAKLILFNGSLGDTTKSEFEEGTKYILNILNEFGDNVIIGGGDTSAFVNKYLPNFKGFLSTGGGATLDFIAEGSLPCIKILA